MSLDLRAYDRDRDLAAVTRIWHEIGWIDDESEEKPLARFLDASNVEVGMIDGAAECAVCWGSGLIRYQDTDLPLAVVSAVTTSRIARRIGLASALTARAVRAAAEAGKAVATLGIFDQGFYDRFGFGTGTYTHALRFDPSSLAVEHVPYRTPVRLTVDDAVECYELMERRHRVHGGVVVHSADVFRSEMEWNKPLLALGYRNDEGRLTHALFGETKGEHGPDNVWHLAYERPEQLLQLLRLLRELGDQLHTVQVWEPPHLQLQDLIRRPFDQTRRTSGTEHQAGNRAAAAAQFRIVDLAAATAARSWSGTEVVCNLELLDPLTVALERADEASGEPIVAGRWSGVGGTYRLTIGASSGVEPVPAPDPALPTLRASVNAFTRCWTGARDASGLALTDELSAPADLLDALDDSLRLPAPLAAWMY